MKRFLSIYSLASALLTMTAFCLNASSATAQDTTAKTSTDTAAVAATGSVHKVVADKIIGVVGDKIILQSDINNAILDAQRQQQQNQGQVRVPTSCDVMEAALAQKALVLQSEKDSIPISEEEIEALLDNQIRGFIQMYGSKDALEQIAGRTVYQIKEDFRTSFKERKQAEEMRKKIVSTVKITPTEVKDYFEKIPVDKLPFYEMEIEVGEIVAYPKASRDLELLAIEELNDFKKQVESGSKKFETLASLYTDDPGSKQTGGMYNINRTEKAWDPAFIANAFRLKEGQVSPVFKSKFGYHIIQMVSRAGDDATVRHILKIPQITDTETNEVIAKLDSVRSRLTSGTLTFGEAVSRYSDADEAKFTGGMRQCGNGSTCTIDQLDKDLVLGLKDLKPGEFSAPRAFTDERGKKSVRIIYLKSRTEPHRENLKDDYNKIAERALDIKQAEAVEKWFNSKIPTFYLQIDSDFNSCPQLNTWMQNITKNQ
ncbi:peptidylprolyl isomerase [Flavihumibacter petaseus]|uniref:Putative peptidyl-prolyl cis-trans isomerase n=1 Tax=Flavihumibacter petaseus NBRC 106054 TaxID=1220578 RepID=A0A0E9MZ28_9BACT|nr:peptidylprolyl isomerase [Flavihumibacter petaseus]GAO42798.1 putative peptidyl-prolyl cis-trans isomerase [Flavihumibacter petaseus NBRC 106054]